MSIRQEFMAGLAGLGLRMPESEYESFVFGTCAAAVLQARPQLDTHQAAIPVAAWMMAGLVEKGFRDPSPELELWNACLEAGFYISELCLRLSTKKWGWWSEPSELRGREWSEVVEIAFWRQLAAYPMMEHYSCSYQEALSLLEQLVHRTVREDGLVKTVPVDCKCGAPHACGSYRFIHTPTGKELSLSPVLEALGLIEWPEFNNA